MSATAADRNAVARTIDTHCHLLPGLDDGPPTEARAVELARELVAAGVATAVCTPHYSRRWASTVALAQARLDTLRARLASIAVPLQLDLAAEIGTAEAASAPMEELARRRLGSRYLLVEVDPMTPSPFFSLMVTRLAPIDLLPVFAHPERARCIQRRPELLDDVRAAGALIQIVAPSVIGRSGEQARKTAWRLLASASVDLMASDAHGGRRGAGDLAVAGDAVSEQFGGTAAELLLVGGPASVLRPLAIESEPSRRSESS